MKLVALSSLVLALVACSQTEPAAETEGGTTDDELRSLNAAEVVGELTLDGSFHEVDAPELRTGSRPEYRALSFQAVKGQKLSIDVIAGNASDAMAYVLSSSYATLARNDDASADSTDSHLEWKASKAGTYYVAFRNKEGWATKYYVRASAEGGAAPAVSWRDGWPEGQSEVAIASSQYSTGYSYTNGCDPARMQHTTQASVRCKVDTTNATIACDLPDLTMRTRTFDIQADGSFSFDLRDTWGRNIDWASGQGRVQAGGLVTFSELTTFNCGPNSSDELYSEGTRLLNGSGSLR